MVKEINPKLHSLIKWTKTEPEEITGDKVWHVYGEGGEIGTTMLYKKLITHLKGPPLTIHRNVVGENVLEVWRRLMHWFIPMTAMWGLHIMLKGIMPPKIWKQQEVHVMMHKWKGLMDVLERDCKENIADMMKICILIHMMPNDLQDSILQHADKIKEHPRRDCGTQTPWTLATVGTTRKSTTTTIRWKRSVLPLRDAVLQVPGVVLGKRPCHPGQGKGEEQRFQG